MKKWKLLKSKPIFQSKWLSLYDNSYKLPNGQICDKYYHLGRSNYVLIVAVNKGNQIVFINQYRRGVDELIYELPAGWIDENEKPEQTAERELKEETGYIGKTKEIFEIYPQPSFCSMKAYVAIVEIDKIRENTNLEQDEDIQVFLKDIKEIKEMIKNGKIKDMGSINAIYLYELSKKQVKWQ